MRFAGMRESTAIFFWIWINAPPIMDMSKGKRAFENELTLALRPRFGIASFLSVIQTHWHTRSNYSECRNNARCNHQGGCIAHILYTATLKLVAFRVMLLLKNTPYLLTSNFHSLSAMYTMYPWPSTNVQMPLHDDAELAVRIKL